MIRRFLNEAPKIDVRYVVQQAEVKPPGCAEALLWIVVLAGGLMLVAGR
jgi:hypothetical protein